MRKILIIACAVLIFNPLSFAYAKQTSYKSQQASKGSNASKIVSNSKSNANAGLNNSQNQDKINDRDRNGDCDNDGIINSEDTDIDESINACKQYQNRNKWESGYNPRSETARQHMSIVAKAVEDLLRFGDELSDKTIGEQIREIARQHGQSAEKIAEDEDKLNQRSGVLKFFIGPDYTAIDDINGQMLQIRNQVRELNQIRTELQNESDQTELQNQIQILQLELTNFQDSLKGQEDVFSMFGWLAKLFN